MTEERTPLAPAELTRRIDAFWVAFRKGEAELIALPVLEQLEQVNETLEASIDGLVLEMSGDDGDDHVEMIASVHGDIEMFPLLLEFVARAPALRHYSLRAFRERTTKPDFPINMEDFELATTDILVGHYADEGRIGLELVFARELPGDMQDHARNMAFIMLDHVLGEYDFAVKVATVDFVEAFSDVVLDSTSLDRFGPVLDSFWSGELGHTGLFPVGEHRWGLMKVKFKGSADGELGLVAVNRSANAVAARPDLGHAVGLRVPAADSAALDRARHLQDQIASRLELGHAGILSHSVMRDSRRLANYYVADLPAALELIQSGLREAGLEDTELTSAFDPAWSRYFDFAGNPGEAS